MIKIPFVTGVDHETITGFILSKEGNSQPAQCVYLHGGGTSASKYRVYEVADPVLKNDINIITFDFSGHGESSGHLKMGRLKKRVMEARAIIDTYATCPLIVCGASMGGYIAIKLLEFYEVETLILMCPALYDYRAYDVQFDQGFTEIIRSHESWRNTDVLQTLAAFTGNVLIIMGEKDEVIPPGVIDLIMQHTTQAKTRELYIIPGCPHKINEWIVNYPQELLNMQQKISEYISTG